MALAGVTLVWDDPLMGPRSGVLLNLPQLPYEVAWQLQKTLMAERVEDRRPDTLVLVEHEPVYTLGRTTKEAHWGGEADLLRSQGFGVYEIERGGSVTYHGPGQIVGYPILRLRDYCSGPKAYMRMLGEVIIRVLGEWGIQGQRAEKQIGIWVSDPQHLDGPLAKIAAMGVRITRGVTMHGFALNVSVDLEPFSRIVPCGIEGCQVTSMAEVLGRGPDLSAVREQVARHFAEVFGLEWKEKFTEAPLTFTFPATNQIPHPPHT